MLKSRTKEQDVYSRDKKINIICLKGKMLQFRAHGKREDIKSEQFHLINLITLIN